MIIKVCGMKDPDNIRQLVSLSIDMLGMIFYKSSPRAVDPCDQKLAGFVKTLNLPVVGVFVDSDASEVLETTERFNLGMIQLHGSETPQFCERIRQEYPVIKAFQIEPEFNFNNLSKYSEAVDYFLFDTRTNLPGGSGIKFNWNLLESYKCDIPYILSGGIGPNDLDAISKFKLPGFAGIDVNSRFELKPGLKDIELLKSFIHKLI